MPLFMLRKVPACLSLPLTFLRLRSDRLLSQGTLKSCRNRRWFTLCFRSLLARLIPSVKYLLGECSLYSASALSRMKSYWLSKSAMISTGSCSSPRFIQLFRTLFILRSSSCISLCHINSGSFSFASSRF